MTGNHNKRKELINKKRLFVYSSAAAFLGVLGVFVNVYDVYVYTSFVTKIWKIALAIVMHSIMILCPVLFIMIIWAFG
jgi:hypothetical protein